MLDESICHFRGVRSICYFNSIFDKKKTPVSNTINPNQTPHYVASDLGLHCLPMTLLQVSKLEWVKNL